MVFSARVDFYYINNNSFLRIQRYCGEAKIATRICNVGPKQLVDNIIRKKTKPFLSQ